MVPTSTYATVNHRQSRPPPPPPVKRLVIGTPGGKQAIASSSSSSSSSSSTTYVGGTNAQTGSVRSSPVHVTATTMSHYLLYSFNKPYPESKPFNPQTIPTELRARVQREGTSGDVPDIPSNLDPVETPSSSSRASTNPTVNPCPSSPPPPPPRPSCDPPVKRLVIGTPSDKQAIASSSSSSTYVGNTNAQTGSVRSSPVHVTTTMMSHSLPNSFHIPIP
jgi:hypothetical protein